MDPDSEMMSQIGIPPRIQEEIKRRAQNDGVSIPDYVEYKLRVGIGREMHREQHGQDPATDRDTLDALNRTLGI